MSTPALKHKAAPHPSTASEDDPCHHLRRASNGYWQLQFTVDRGRESAPRREEICLRTRCELLDRERRDVVLMAMGKARLVAASVE